MPTITTESPSTSQPTFLEQKWKKSGVAPLVQVDRDELGDKRLNPEEAVCREREDLLKQASKHQIWGQKELEDHERSAGPRMPYTELIRRLHNINPSIKIREGKPGSVAVYFLKPREDWENVSYAGDTKPSDEFFLDHRYITGFEKEPLPEYSHVTLDTSRLPVREIRGWRSVLIALIKAHVITYEQAIHEFGDPSNDKRSTRWLDQTLKYRKG
jgi:hypothetical protein